MFSDLGNFGAQRSKRQAFGFYLVYLLILIILAMLAGIASAPLLPITNQFLISQSIGTIISGIGCAALTYLVVKSKGIIGSFSAIIYIILALALGLILGGFAGVIVPAVLTTKAST